MPPLRVGLALDSFTVPAWIARAIESLATSPHAVLAAVFRTPSLPARPRSLYERLDAAKFRTRYEALDGRDVSALLADVPEPGADADELDVIVAFASPPAGVHARHGIWTIEISDGIAERNTRQRHTIATLRNGETILATARVATDPISLHRAVNRLRWKSAALPARAMRDLRLGVRTPQPALSPPSPCSLKVTTLLSIAASFAMHKVRDVAMNEQWMVAFSFNSSDPRSFHRIEPPKNCIWADPFVIQDGDRAWIFVEEMSFSELRGMLAVIEARRDGTWSPPVRILDRPYHLSYPCVFRWNGAFYMVPETGSDRTVQLFRATDFPLRWEHVSVLLADIEAVDPTPFEYDGRWWMYLTTASSPNLYDELSLYSAATPLGPWTPHPLNPVVSDLAGGRCAGRPFRRDGKLVRAAQDCVKRYGHSMELREIVTLTDSAWEERVVDRILPDWARGLTCTHTLNVDGEVTVIDGARDRFR